MIVCGRYTLRRINLIRAALDAVPTLPFEEFSEHPRFNIAPSQLIPLVRVDSRQGRVIDLARWGFIPSWAKSMPRVTPINARCDTLAGSAMFRAALRRGRCLIPADGFYEWKVGTDKGAKQPWFIRFKDDRPFAFAGLCESWKPREDAPWERTCTIITTSPNELVKPLHNRMPVILRPQDYERWLDPDVPVENVCELLQPHPADEMEAYPINPRINRAAEEGAELIEPCSPLTSGSSPTRPRESTPTLPSLFPDPSPESKDP